MIPTDTTHTDKPAGAECWPEDPNRHTSWIKTLADLQGGRPFFSDQTVSSLGFIGRLAQVHKPSLIIELGTNFGLSLRRWREAVPTVPVICVDASFNALKQSAGVLPIDLTGVKLVEKMVHDIDLKTLWTNGDDVLLYVDVHSDHQCVFDAIPKLPDSSIVIFDDVWRSQALLNNAESKEWFFKHVVFPQVDQTAPMEIMPRSYSEYWRGGAFWGFEEVPLICKWAAENKITLHWTEGVKVVWFQWPQDKVG